MASEELDEPYPIPAEYPRGRYLLVFDPLDGSSNIDVNVSVGTIFSVLRTPEGVTTPTVEDFLQPGTEQVCRRLRDLRPVDDAGAHGRHAARTASRSTARSATSS